MPGGRRPEGGDQLEAASFRNATFEGRGRGGASRSSLARGGLRCPPCRRQRRDAGPDRQHRQDRGQQARSRCNFVYPKTIVNGEELRSSTRPTRNRSARTPSRWSTRARSRRRRRSARPASRRSTSARRSPNGTASRAERPADQEPGRRPARTAGTREGNLTKKGDSWFTGRSRTPRSRRRSPSTRPKGRRRSLHVRDPSLDARLDRGPARRASGHVRVADSPSSTPGAPSFPRRPGRRRARLGCCRSRAAGRLLGPAARAASARPARSRSRPACRYPGSCAATRDRASPIREAEVQVLPGRKTRMWTYGGTFPGPTIRRPGGRAAPRSPSSTSCPREVGRADRPPARRPQPQRVRRPARRPDRAPTALLLLPDSRAASRRASSGNDLLIEPGRQQDLRLRPESRTAAPNAPPSSGTTTTASTTRRATSGAAWRGCGSSTTSFDASLPLPSGECDLPLMIVDRSFDRHNQLADPFTGLRPPADGIIGDRDPRQRRPPAPPPGRAAPLPAADPQRLAVPLLQPLPLQRRARWSRSAPTAA